VTGGLRGARVGNFDEPRQDTGSKAGVAQGTEAGSHGETHEAEPI